MTTTVYAASDRRADPGKAWGVVRSHVAGHDAPSTSLGVATLGHPDQ